MLFGITQWCNLGEIYDSGENSFPWYTYLYYFINIKIYIVIILGLGIGIILLSTISSSGWLINRFKYNVVHSYIPIQYLPGNG